MVVEWNIIQFHSKYIKEKPIPSPINKSPYAARESRGSTPLVQFLGGAGVATK